MATKKPTTVVRKLTPSLPTKTDTLDKLRADGVAWIRDPKEPGFYLRLVSPPAWSGKYKERDPDTDKVTYPIRKLGSVDDMTRDEARAILRERRAVEGGYVPEVDVAPTVDEGDEVFTLAEAWKERQGKPSKRIKGRPMAASTIRTTGGRLNRYCQAWLKRDINEITYLAITKLAAKVSAGEFEANGRRYGTPRVAHDLLTDLSGIWKGTRAHHDPKLVKPNYFALVLEDYPAPDSTHHRPLTETERAALFNTTRDEVDDLATWLHFLFCRFQALTCMRPAGVANLLDRQVNTETRIVDRKNGDKTGKRYVTGLCQAAVDIVDEVREIKLDPDQVPDYVAESPYLFPSLKTGKPFSEASYPGEYVAAWLEKNKKVDLGEIAAAGYTYPDTTRDRLTGETKPHPRAGEGKLFTPHDLRHNWASVADDGEVNTRIISVFLGHAKKDVTDMYISKKPHVLVNAAETVSASLLG